MLKSPVNLLSLFVGRTLRLCTLAFVLCFLVMPQLKMQGAEAREMPPNLQVLETGLWLVQDRDGVVEISFCCAKPCGRLVGMRYDGRVPKDKWGRSQCGLYLLTDFTRDNAAQLWRGRIMDPESGHIYDAQMRATSPGVLVLRGFLMGVPLFGKTQTWTRFTGSIGANCRLFSKDVISK